MDKSTSTPSSPEFKKAGRREKILALLCAVGSNVVFGFSIIFTKLAYSSGTTSVAVMLMWRFIVAFTVMTLMIPFLKAKPSFKGKKLIRVISLALLEPVLYFVFENNGIMLSTATLGAVILALIPIFSLVFGVFLLKERPTCLQIVFSVVSLSGAMILSLQQSQNDGEFTVVGLILLVCAASVSALFYTMTRRISAEFTPFERTYVMSMVAALFFIFLALAENRHEPVKLILPFSETEFIVSLIYLSVISSVAAYMAVNYATTYMPISRFVAFSNLQSTISVFSGIVIFGDFCNALTFIAAFITLGGVFAVQFLTPGYVAELKRKKSQRKDKKQKNES